MEREPNTAVDQPLEVDIVDGDIEVKRPDGTAIVTLTAAAAEQSKDRLGDAAIEASADRPHAEAIAIIKPDPPAGP